MREAHSVCMCMQELFPRTHSSPAGCQELQHIVRRRLRLSHPVSAYTWQRVGTAGKCLRVRREPDVLVKHVLCVFVNYACLSPETMGNRLETPNISLLLAGKSKLQTRVLVSYGS